jgi:hypothetical protein
LAGPVGVEVELDYGQDDRDLAEVEIAHLVRQLQDDLVDADAVGDLLVHDLEFETSEDLRLLAAQADV